MGRWLGGGGGIVGPRGRDTVTAQEGLCGLPVGKDCCIDILFKLFSTAKSYNLHTLYRTIGHTACI